MPPAGPGRAEPAAGRAGSPKHAAKAATGRRREAQYWGWRQCLMMEWSCANLRVSSIQRCADWQVVFRMERFWGVALVSCHARQGHPYYRDFKLSCCISFWGLSGSENCTQWSYLEAFWERFIVFELYLEMCMGNPDASQKVSFSSMSAMPMLRTLPLSLTADPVVIHPQPPPIPGVQDKLNPVKFPQCPFNDGTSGLHRTCRVISMGRSPSTS